MVDLKNMKDEGKEVEGGNYVFKVLFVIFYRFSGIYFYFGKNINKI